MLSRARPCLGEVLRPALTVALLGLALGNGCSSLLSSSTTQCTTDVDCVRFSGAACDGRSGLCVPRLVPLGSGGAAQDAGVPRGDRGTGGGPARSCPDLDANGVLDCEESLLSNPDFAAGVVGWKPEPNMMATFDARDAFGFSGSGSIAVTNSAQSTGSDLIMGGAVQCVSTPGMINLTFYGQAFLASQGTGPGTTMGAAFDFYPAGDCYGSSTGATTIMFSDSSVSGWRMLQGTVSQFVGTRSLAVRLVVTKPPAQPATQALFDNILIRPQ